MQSDLVHTVQRDVDETRNATFDHEGFPGEVTHQAAHRGVLAE